MELYNKIKDLEDFLDKEENIIAIKDIQEKIKNNEDLNYSLIKMEPTELEQGTEIKIFNYDH